jgi:hypothetical protein
VAIGNRFPEQHLVGASTDFRAGRDGPLALYVNDAVTPIPSWDALYKNNTGGAAPGEDRAIGFDRRAAEGIQVRVSNPLPHFPRGALTRGV